MGNQNNRGKRKEAQIIEEAIPETVVDETPTEPVYEYGVVTDCARLNVRKEPDIRSSVVCVIKENDEVMIDKDSCTDGWYSVFTAEGLSGYCMKEYITKK